jgi:choline dehydrogenase-like flavoprotein
VRYDVVVVGGGTAGCVLAARLSESPDRRVCLVEAGPDHGLLAEGRWPADILDARDLARSHLWAAGGEDGRSLGGRLLGGSSSVNACMVVAGSPADYDEWGPEWSYADVRPFLDRARSELRTSSANTDRPTAYQRAFLEAAQAAGLPLVDVDDPATPVGVGAFPANVVHGTRWNASFAHLDPARARPNLSILGEMLVDRVVFDGSRATGVVTADGRQLEADTVLLAAGAYFSPAILLRSGIGPEAELRRLGIAVVEDLPVGKRLLDHCGTDVSFEVAPELQAQTGTEAAEGGVFAAHAVAKVASTSCAPDSWDLHLVPWISRAEDDRFRAYVIVFHMKPLSTGSVRLRSADPADAPLVERGFLSRGEDLGPLLEGVELARAIAGTEPLKGLLAAELAPADLDPEEYVRGTIRNYFHPAGTCPLGTVVDTHGRVFGVDGLHVADASFMPTIPRANTNLTTAAVAEKIAAGF